MASDWHSRTKLSTIYEDSQHQILIAQLVDSRHQILIAQLVDSRHVEHEVLGTNPDLVNFSLFSTKILKDQITKAMNFSLIISI